MLITILSYPRTGSTYLQSSITNRSIYSIKNSNADDTVSLGELYNYRQTASLEKFINNNFNLTCDVKTKDGLAALINCFNELNLHLCIKIFCNILPKYEDMPARELLTIEDLVNYSGLVIHNYRMNTLNSWISRARVAVVGEWQNRRWKSKHKQFDNKILWSKSRFLHFAKGRRYEFKEFSNLTGRMDYKKFINLQYEESITIGMHENIRRKCFEKNIKAPNLYDSEIMKFSTSFELYRDNFYNPEEFDKDYESIENFINLTLV